MEVKFNSSIRTLDCYKLNEIVYIVHVHGVPEKCPLELFLKGTLFLELKVCYKILKYKSFYVEAGFGQCNKC